MRFDSWKFFVIALVLALGLLDWSLLIQSVSGFVGMTEGLVPTLVVIAIALMVRSIYPDTPPVWLKWLLTLAVTGLAIRYLYWRGTETLLWNWWEGPLSVTVFAMEVLATVNANLVAYQTIRLTNRTAEATTYAKPVLRGEYLPTVDILIPTYQEPAELLRRTLVGCQSMHYPHTTIWVLDDGDRPEIAALATELGCNYLARRDSTHAKAGNLNHGLQFATGEIVVTFDADFVPLNHFLTRTIGFFTDPQVAMVATPQNFYNPDPPEINLGGRILPHEQTVFYSIIQQGRDTANSIICTGTSILFRRQALDAIGGFATGTIVEDWVTGMLLQAKGYRTVYLNELLSVGAAPNTMNAYLIQRLRWAEGTVRILFTRRNPLWMPGLNWKQRVNHLSGILYWIDQMFQSVAYISPLLYLLFRMRSLDTDLIPLLSHWLPAYVAGFILLSWTIGSRTVLVSFVYNIIQCFHLIPVFFGIIRAPRYKPKFRVTPKETQINDPKFNAWVLSPIIGLLVPTVLSLGLVLVLTSVQYKGDIYLINLLWVVVLGLVLLKQAQRDNGRFNWWVLSPLIALLIPTLLSFGLGLAMVGGHHESDTYSINVLWTQFNLLVLGLGLLAGINSARDRAAPRVEVKTRCYVTPTDLTLADFADGRSTPTSSQAVSCEVSGSRSVLAALEGQSVTLTVEPVEARGRSPLISSHSLIHTSQSFSTQILDISEGGIALRPSAEITINRGQILAVSLPTENLYLYAKVQRAGSVIGCEFINLTPAQIRQLINFVYCRPTHWRQPKVAREGKALLAIAISLLELYPLRRLR